MKLTGENRSNRGKTCLSATLPTINPNWTDPGSKRGERPATNRLSHGMAITLLFYLRFLIVMPLMSRLSFIGSSCKRHKETVRNQNFCINFRFQSCHIRTI
jgi:hypothetical protein